MELQISYRICTEVSAKSVLHRKTSSNRKDTAVIMRMEKRTSNRSGSVPGSYPYVFRDTAENGSLKFYGIPKGKEQHIVVRAIRRAQI